MSVKVRIASDKVGTRTSLTDKDEFSPGNHWHSLVERYSDCALSFPDKDKLIAISGLAKKLHPMDRCVAGLWIENIYRDLLWRVPRHGGEEEVEEKEKCSRNDQRAPSWSWASMNGPVRFNYRSNYFGKPLGTTEDLAVHMDSNEPFGPVQRGVIQASAALGTVTVGRHLNGTYDIGRPPTGSRVTLWPVLQQSFLAPGRKWYEGLILIPTGLVAGQYHRHGYFSAHISLENKNSHVGEATDGDADDQGDDDDYWSKDLENVAFEAFRTRLNTEAYEAYLGQDQETGFHRYQFSIV